MSNFRYAKYGNDAGATAIDDPSKSRDLNDASILAVQPVSPSLFCVTDSIQAQSFNAPNAAFYGTVAKGSSTSSVGVKTAGVTNIFSENPVRLRFRAAHNLVTGDDGMMRELPSNHPLAYRRFKCTVVDATDITLDGFDGRNLTPFTSAAAASDALFEVDACWSNFGPLSWMMYEAGYPYESVTGLFRNGASAAMLAAELPNVLTEYYSGGLIHCGRNETVFNEEANESLAKQMLQRCGTVMVVLPFPDDNWTTPASDSQALKIAQTSRFWYAKQAQNPRIRVSDLFGVFSNPVAVLESSIDAYISSDGVHPQANGALVAGTRNAQDFFQPFNAPRKAISRFGIQGPNLLTDARFLGEAGTVGTGVTGTVATGWTVGSRSSANVTGGYVQVCQTPARLRRNSALFAAGDILDIGDGWWYLVKTGGTTAAALPAGYATATMFDSTTGVTDGTVVAFRIPKFTDSLDYVRWQFLDVRLTADANNDWIEFFKTLAVPGSVVPGDYIRAQIDIVIAGGFSKQHPLNLIIKNAGTTQIAAGIALGTTNLIEQRPSLPIRPRTMRTPKRSVPSGASTLEFRVRLNSAEASGGVQYFLGLPLIEEVAPTLAMG